MSDKSKTTMLERTSMGKALKGAFFCGLENLQAQSTRLQGVSARLHRDMFHNNLGLMPNQVRLVKEIADPQFTLQLNEARAKRPGFQNGQPHTDIPHHLIRQLEDKHYPIESDSPECFDVLEESGLRMHFLYNPYPYVPHQFIAIPNPEELREQFIDPVDSWSSSLLKAIVRMVWEGSDDEMHLRIGFTSRGAHSSMNHLHFPGMLIPAAGNGIPLDHHLEAYHNLDQWVLPHSIWLPRQETSIDRAVDRMLQLIYRINQHNEASEVDALTNLKRLQDKVAYSFYISPEGIAFFPRRAQGYHPYVEYLHDLPLSTGMGFYEMLGQIITADQMTYAILNEIGQEGRELFIQRLYNLIALPDRLASTLIQ